MSVKAKPGHCASGKPIGSADLRGGGSLVGEGGEGYTRWVNVGEERIHGKKIGKREDGGGHRGGLQVHISGKKIRT